MNKLVNEADFEHFRKENGSDLHRTRNALTFLAEVDSCSTRQLAAKRLWTIYITAKSPRVEEDIRRRGNYLPRRHLQHGGVIIAMPRGPLRQHLFTIGGVMAARQAAGVVGHRQQVVQRGDSCGRVCILTAKSRDHEVLDTRIWKLQR